MKTIALTLDDDVYRRAEQKAEALRTSISQVAADYVRVWAVDDVSQEDARRRMIARFAQPDWQFGVGQPDDRTQRNARD
jgi:hypothetical protein